MMAPAPLIFSSWNWLWIAAGISGLACLLLLWSYRSAPPGLARWLCPLLKALGLTALALCLLEPLWSGQRVRPGANLFAVIADNSQGLQIKDQGATRSRGELLKNLLLDSQQARWLSRIEENFEVRRYFFDARLQTAKDFGELDFNGRASAIGSSLRTVADRFQDRPLAGILLLTDGNATDLREAPDMPGLPPVYPVIIGGSDPVRDISVQRAHATQTAFEDAPVTVQADVSVTGFRGESIVARLLDASGKQVQEQSLKARKNEDLLSFRFQLKPEKSGLSFYRVSVSERAEPGLSTRPDKSPEVTSANNEAIVVVDRGRGPFRILYVSGRPNWEYKFLNRAVQEDEQLDLVGLIRVAKREPKFNFLGRSGETSNPLFRGFGDQSPESVERYDQPVLVRLNTRDELELRGGFPRAPEELYGYHAVIVDDVEAEFFTPDQASLLQKYVSERGGGFFMLGGMESFQNGKYHRTPIGDMLPVYLDRLEETNKTSTRVRLDLTREGWLQPWARLRDNEPGEKTRLSGMPPFQTLNRFREVKPGASVIATVADAEGKTYPALVAQRFGRGRTVALAVGDLWRWGFQDSEAHQDMDKTWRQWLRWLVTDVPNRVDLTIQPQPGDPNGAVLLQARVRDEKFQPLDDAAINLEVSLIMTGGAKETNAVHLSAEPSSEEAGLYQATYLPRATGGYQATAWVTNSSGAAVGRAAAGWSTDLAAEEFRSLTPNRALLEAIARKTGGSIISMDKLEQFAEKLPHRRAPVMDSWTYPLWHTPLFFGFALACLVSEWGLRRWKGLP